MRSLVLVEKYSQQLVEKLNRSREELLEEGLSCGDFNQQVSIKFQDGSNAFFNYAFFVVNELTKTCAVFTEHCGYFEFSSVAVKITESSGSSYVDELYEEY